MLTHWSQLVPDSYVNRRPRTLSITGRKEGRKEGAHEQVRKQPRRDQEQGGGAGLYRESWTSSASVVSQRRSYGHCLCDSVLQSSWDSNCVVLWSLDTALTSCCSGGGPRQPRSSGLAPVSRFHSSVPLFPLVPVPNGPSRLRGR